MDSVLRQHGMETRVPLNPADVRAVQFGTTRLKSGYDMDEVDAFLDIIEADIAQYADELQRSRESEAVLRTQLEQVQARLLVAERRIADLHEEAVRFQSVAAEPPTVVTAELQALLTSQPEAAAVLGSAQRTAEDIVRQAQIRADAVRAAMRLVLQDQLAALDRD
jgi:DivIVA domain-containing protein